jgi:TetR/AcrR family transcriptional repressor of nem operon
MRMPPKRGRWGVGDPRSSTPTHPVDSEEAVSRRVTRRAWPSSSGDGSGRAPATEPCLTLTIMSEMTDSVQEIAEKPRTGAPAAGKRERLTVAAIEVLHRQGVEATTLADIAAAAEVPVGNVYYYFKTKDELVGAALRSHSEMMSSAFAELSKHRTPRARLRAYIRMLTDQRDLVAASGCPQGSLCSELDKRGDALAGGCARLMAMPIDWAEKQFHEMGRRDARDLAVALVASYQGIALLTNTFRDPEMMAREGKRLERWIDSLT